MSYNLFNLSLDFLQKMSREQAMEYFRWGDGLNYKQLVANIIQAATALRWDETRGVREFWYNPIKPIVLRLFPGIQTPGGDAKKEKQFNSVLSDMRKAKQITYKQLGIVDYRTMRKRYESIDKAKCWNNIILFVEKDSAYIHLRPLADLLNITILSGAGWSNTAAAESLYDQLDKNREYEIYGVSDHDPYGYGIGIEASTKLEIIGLKIKKYLRIGISPKQISKGIQDSQKYPVKITLKSAPQWCEDHGLEGPYQRVYKTVTKDEVKRKVLVYEGTKCYGLEIEAVSGQPGGPKMLRRIVLEALLEYLKENDRIDEILTDIWENIEQEVLEYHLDSETLSAWKELGVDRTLREYLTSGVYESRSEDIEIEKEEATEESQAKLNSLEEEIGRKRIAWDTYIAQEYSEFEEKIDELRKKHILPLQEERDSVIEMMRDNRDEDLSPLESRSASLEGFIADLEGPYDAQLSYLAEEYQKSRALFAEAVVDWLSDNIEDYYKLGRTVEDLSFGLMTGYLMEAMEKGETINDLFERVTTFDSWRAYEYISSDIDGDETIQWQINENLQQLIASALKGAA